MKKTIQILTAAVVLFWAVSCLGQSREAVMASGGEDELTEPKQVALTFDDGPHADFTPELLEGLRQRGVHATFFLIGDSIDGKEDIVRQMKEDGHLIGNHTSSHVQLTKENEKEACDEINRTNQKIYDITGEWPEYIRPPFGSWSEELECMVPMTVVLWDVDTFVTEIKKKSKKKSLRLLFIYLRLLIWIMICKEYWLSAVGATNTNLLNFLLQKSLMHSQCMN